MQGREKHWEAEQPESGQAVKSRREAGGREVSGPGSFGDKRSGLGRRHDDQMCVEVRRLGTALSLSCPLSAGHSSSSSCLEARAPEDSCHPVSLR